jgi:lipoyl(octanoyl) transferase
VNAVQNRKTKFIHLGLADYKQAWDFQTRLFEEILAIKKRNREVDGAAQEETPNYLIFCEHPHVYTLGKSGKETNLLIDPEKLQAIGATYYHINRGGDITYHGPGQIVCYPVLDLENFFTDIHQYMRLLEEAVIQTCARSGIHAGRIKGLTGVWVDPENEISARKICALGVKTSRWVTMHGLAFNVNTDLAYFNNIIPCGIDNKAVTSVAYELQAPQNMSLLEQQLKQHLVELFGLELHD